MFVISKQHDNAILRQKEERRARELTDSTPAHPATSTLRSFGQSHASELTLCLDAFIVQSPVLFSPLLSLRHLTCVRCESSSRR
jgi:hypothetical protein